MNLSSLTLEFNKLLQEELSNFKPVEDDVCLITKEKLNKVFITLKCNHTFNYEAIYNEIYKQKLVKNYKEVQKLDRNSIKCPYCRTVHNRLLPHKPGFAKTKYVNWPPSKSMDNPYFKNKCTYCFKSGKRKGLQCNKKCENEFCGTHLKYILKNNKKSKNTTNDNKNTTNDNKNSKITCEEKFNNPTLIYPCEKGVYSIFRVSCDHCVTKGINKGKKCDATFHIYEFKEGIIKKQRLCTKHRKLKMYNNIDEKYLLPNIIPINIAPSLVKYTHQIKTEEDIKDFIKMNYPFYTSHPNYILDGTHHKDLNKLQFIKI